MSWLGVLLKMVMRATKTLKDIQVEAYALAKSKGWWNCQRSVIECLCLMHSEISEALEEIRNGRQPAELYYEAGGKPCGFGIELADTIIRICDLAEHCGLDLGELVAMKQEYNSHRPFRHGGKTA